jgi:hypothetical protein
MAMIRGCAIAGYLGFHIDKRRRLENRTRVTSDGFVSGAFPLCRYFRKLAGAPSRLINGTQTNIEHEKEEQIKIQR